MKKILLSLVLIFPVFLLNAQQKNEIASFPIREFFLEKVLEVNSQLKDNHDLKHYYSDNLKKYIAQLEELLKEKYNVNENNITLDILKQGIGIVAGKVVDDFQIYVHSNDRTENQIKETATDDFVAKALNEPCNNANFETGNFTGWDLLKGKVNNQPYGVTNMQTTSPGTQHFITNGGFDPKVPNSVLPKVNPDGGSYSVQLGDYTNGSNAASMRQTFLVDANSTSYTYSYAIVLQDPADHDLGSKPFFKVNMYNESNISIPCGAYSVISGAGGDPGFVSFITKDTTYLLGFPIVENTQAYYLPWRTTFIPLDDYIGQNITIEFIVGDCSQDGHFGYAYIDADCSMLEVTKSADASCDGQPITLSAPPGAASYSWTPGGQTTASITTTTPGTYNVVVTPVSGSGCSTTLTTTITGSTDHPVADFSAVPTNICVGGSVNVEDLSYVSGSSSITSWKWDFNGDGVIDNTTQNPGSYTYNNAGNYNISLTVGSNGCTDTKTIPVSVNNGPSPGWSAPVSLCPDSGPVNLNDLITGSTGGTWSGVGVNGNTFNPSAGTQQVTYSVSSSVCDANETHIIVVLAPVTIDFTLPEDICVKGQPVDLTATPAGGTFTINGQTITQFNPAVHGVGQHIIAYTISDPSNPQCMAQITDTIKVVDGVTITANVPKYFCFHSPNQPIDIQPAGGQLSGALVSGNELTVSTAQPGNYSFTYDYTTPEGCSSSYIHNFTVGSEVAVAFTVSQDCFQNVTLTAKPVVGTFADYRWYQGTTSFGSGSSYGSHVETPGEYTYSLEATNVYGCKAYYSEHIFINEGIKPENFVIPNVLTPNNDNKNDFITMPMMDNDCITYKVLILNRWGNLVYEATQANPVFSGKDMNGHSLSDGVYFYKIVSDDFDCDSAEYKPMCYGFITIVSK